MDLEEKIRAINGFPKERISFKDITTLLSGKGAYEYTVDLMVDDLKGKGIIIVAVLGARGFLFGPTIACALGVGFISVRKPGKLPGEVLKYSYGSGYGTDKLKVYRDVVKRGDKVAVVGNSLATGGTMNVVAKLIEKDGGEITAMEFLIELTELGRRDINKNYYINTPVQYES